MLLTIIELHESRDIIKNILHVSKLFNDGQTLLRLIKTNSESNTVVSLNVQSNPKDCRISGSGAKAVITDDLI